MDKYNDLAKFINKWRLLLNYYKIVNLKEEELALIMLIMHLSVSRNVVIPTLIAKYSNLNVTEIELILSSLKKRELLILNDNYLDFRPIFNKIFEYIVDKEQNEENFKEIFKIINNVLLNKLTFKEKNQIVKLIQSRLTSKQVLDILKSFEKKQNFNIIFDKLKDYIKNQPNSFTNFDWLNVIQ